MKIIIVSDTHGRDEEIEAVVAMEEPFDCLIHCGDVEGREIFIEALCGTECYLVAGNNDFYTELPFENIVELGTHRILVTHGHYYGVSGEEYSCLVSATKERGCDMVIFGHIHKPVYQVEDGITILNPGSLSFPRQRGRRGTYIVMQIEENGHEEIRVEYI